MTDDIVQRLRARADPTQESGVLCDLLQQAADEIERLRGAITTWAEARDAADRGQKRDDDMSAEKYAQAQVEMLRRAIGR